MKRFLKPVAYLMLFLATSGVAIFAFGSDSETQSIHSEPQIIRDFGIGTPHRASFDSILFDDRIFVTTTLQGATIQTFEISPACQLKGQQSILETDSFFTSNQSLWVRATRERVFILGGSMQLDALTTKNSEWHRIVVVPRQASVAVPRYRSVDLSEDQIHVAQVETIYAERNVFADKSGKVHITPAKRSEVLRYFTIQADESPKLQGDEVVADLTDVGVPRTIQIRVVGGVPTIALLSSNPSGSGQLDLFNRIDQTWTHSPLKRYNHAINPIVHISEKGNVYAPRPGSGLYEFELDKIDQQPKEWIDHTPTVMGSASGLMAWVDSRRAGQEWWGYIPFSILAKPNTSPEWLNNDILVNRKEPRILTPWPSRIETFRVHHIDGKLILIWLGYQNFDGKSEVFDRQPLRLLCQSFDWQKIQ